MEVAARDSVDEISHRVDTDRCVPLSLGPGGHQSVRQRSTEKGDSHSDQPGHLDVFLASDVSELHGDTAASLGLGHAPEGKLGDEDQPGESVGVSDKGWKGQSEQGEGSPESDLSLDLCLIGFDNEPIRPCGGVPFFVFARPVCGNFFFQAVSVI